MIGWQHLHAASIWAIGNRVHVHLWHELLSMHITFVDAPTKHGTSIRSA